MKLIQGDCLEAIKTIPDKSIDLIITDPPYLQVDGGRTSKRFNSGVRNKDSSIVKDMSNFGKEKIFELMEVVKPKMKTFNAYIFCSRLQVPLYLEWAIMHKFNFDILVWDKLKSGMISYLHFAPNIEYIIRINEKGLYKVEGNSQLYQKIKRYKVPSPKVHEAEKPVELIEELIKVSSLENQTVLDCFMGSGTTGVACKNTNRNFIGIELDEKYFNIAKERIELA